MRTRFDQQLGKLNVELITMGALCEEAIGLVADALTRGATVKSNEISSLEVRIDHKERDIESLCMKLLLQQQPVAGDLRVISSALKMISDMERIGDQAADIAEIARDMKDNDLRHSVPLEDMAREAVSMVTDSVDSFVKRDQELAHQVIARDDRVDDLFIQVRAELIRMIAEGRDGEVCLDIMMVAKYFERIGDHACNIAQWVEYALTGQYEED